MKRIALTQRASSKRADGPRPRGSGRCRWHGIGPELELELESMAETEMMAPKTVATETTVPSNVGELDSKSIGLTSAMIAFERIPAAEGRHMLGQGGSRWGLGEQRVRLRKAAANY